MSPTPQQLILHCNRLKAERAGLERQWREIAAYMRPQHLPALLGESSAPRRSVLLLVDRQGDLRFVALNIPG